MRRRKPKDPLTQPRPVGRYKRQFGVIVVCDNEKSQHAAYEKLRALGYACKVVVT